MLNHITIMGRLTHDLELRRTQSGTAVVSFSLAVDRDFKDKQTGKRETDFIDVVAFGQTAEFACRYFSKGRAMAVSGRLQTRSWTDNDGNKRRNTAIFAENVYFADAKRENQSGPSVDSVPERDEWSEVTTPEEDEQLPF